MSDEEQQEDAKQPKSPVKEDVQQAEQHGSGGEGGDEMETEHMPWRMGMTEEEIGQWWRQYIPNPGRDAVTGLPLPPLPLLFH